MANQTTKLEKNDILDIVNKIVTDIQVRAMRWVLKRGGGANQVLSQKAQENERKYQFFSKKGVGRKALIYGKVCCGLSKYHAIHLKSTHFIPCNSGPILSYFTRGY